jgi:hypothetical protein
VFSDPDSIRSVDPEGRKLPPKLKKLRNFMFLSSGCSLLKGSKLLLQLGHLLWRSRDKYIPILNQKNIIFFSCQFFSIFGHQNP